VAGIAGIFKAGEKDLVKKMLEKLSHRGKSGNHIIETEKATLGAVWSLPQTNSAYSSNEQVFVQDSAGRGHISKAGLVNGKFALERDELGIAPLYFGKTDDGTLCFASEVKSLLIATKDVNEFLPGHKLTDEKLTQYFHLAIKEECDYEPEVFAAKLRRLLEESISGRIKSDSFGSWLSGGLDSSTIAAIAKPYVKTLHTFSAGLKNAPDLEFARIVADHIKSNHHEVIVDFNEMIKKLPEVIYHLESFDALLVRSSIINYIAAKVASDYVFEIFSGEGGDELFAGYEYIKSLPPQSIPDELIDITGRLHNTAFQRVDRCASAHSTIPHVVFADPKIFNYALSIPAKYKLKDGVEKWILRQAVKDALPSSVLNRTKAKFWEGSGVNELISDFSSKKISDRDFSNERILANGWNLNSKEELLYYRIFKEHFGEAINYNWMGRTKGITN
jgi:asparagine synthase (glutamine-hydrolysing)